MTDLPPVEQTVAPGDVNKNTLLSQQWKWGAIICVVGVPGLIICYTMLFQPKHTKTGEEPQRIVATGQAAAGDGPSGILGSSGEQQQRAGQLQQELARQQQDNAQLIQRNEQLSKQLEANNADAAATIGFLEKHADLTSGPPATGQGGMTGGVGAPLQGIPTPPPSWSTGSGTPVAGASRAEPEGPPPIRRSMGSIKISASSPRAVPTLDVADGAKASSGGGATGGVDKASTQTGGLQILDTKSFVPPNAYAHARVLVGVDAAASVRDAADPKPVLFRITGPAISVGENGRFQETDIRGCLVNGAAYGELSSEKVYIKLQRISCPVGADKHAVGTVEGYVTFKGKAGVRGQVVSREGGLSRKALIAGTLQGLGSGLSANYSRQGLPSVGGLTQKMSADEIAQGSVGTGVSTAASMLADYYIKRAEQYQPVIEMPTGIDVEIVFLSGFQIAEARK